MLDIPIFEDPINKIFCYKFHDVIIALSKISVQIKYEITTYILFIVIFLPHIISTISNRLEPEDVNLRDELERTIKKSKLKGDNMIKCTPFTSADMVLIIVLNRKVK